MGFYKIEEISRCNRLKLSGTKNIRPLLIQIHLPGGACAVSVTLPGGDRPGGGPNVNGVGAG